jgi:hypothetical protein
MLHPAMALLHFLAHPGTLWPPTAAPAGTRRGSRLWILILDSRLYKKLITNDFIMPPTSLLPFNAFSFLQLAPQVVHQVLLAANNFTNFFGFFTWAWSKSDILCLFEATIVVCWPNFIS